MELLIISGLSGAGKSQAAAILEDFDYYCVDNMPIELVPKFAELCLTAEGKYDKVALVMDVRMQEPFDKLFNTLDQMQSAGVRYSVLYMTASLPTILNRYKETRRPHPLMENGLSLELAVELERNLLRNVRARASYVIDTTGFTLAMLRNKLREMFIGDAQGLKMGVNIISFGFKNGLPLDADLVFDVRFLPNPYYESELRELSGCDQAVKDYIFGHKDSGDFVEKLIDMLTFLLPRYSDEGKAALTIAFGCTGGHHRSVAIAEEIGEKIIQLGYPVNIRHRDIEH